MSIRYQILCSAKEKQFNKIIISHIGGKNPLGETWILKVEQAVEDMLAGNLEFFMNLNGQTYPIVISQNQGEFELTSIGADKNLILELPDCPE